MGDLVIGWTTVETLAPETMSVASVGDAPRGFAGWQRVLQRQLSKMPAIYDGLTTARIAEAMITARDHAQEVELRIPTRAGLHRLLIRPVFGPAGDVHAIRLWLGPGAAEVPPPPPAVGAIWDLPSQTIAQPGGVTRLTGIPAHDYVPRLSIAELFHRMSGFDRHTEVLDLLYGPVPGAKLQFDATVRTDGEPPGRWRISMRARDDERTRGAWLLLEEVAGDPPPLRWATLEQVGLREAHRRAGTHLAVVQLDHGTISHWLTDPAPWIRWDYLFQPTDVFHPEDRDRLRELDARVRGGDTAGITVRTLNYPGGYTPTSMLLYPYPGYSVRQLSIAQLTLADDLRVPEPPGRGVPGSARPVGYDDQLQYRLAEKIRGSL